MGEIGVAAAGSLISDRQGEGVLVGGVTNHDKEQEKSSPAAFLCSRAMWPRRHLYLCNIAGFSRLPNWR